MLIKILKGECIFSEQGTHVCDERGFAIVASEDMDCEVTDRIDIVKQILKDQRALRGLDENGNIPSQEVAVSPAEEPPPAEDPAPPAVEEPAPAVEEPPPPSNPENV